MTYFDHTEKLEILKYLPSTNKQVRPTTTDCDDTKKLYADNDGDGFGSTVLVACGGVENNTDCNDNTGTLYADINGDGFGNGAPAACGVTNNTDNCPNTSNTDQKDLDKDGIGDCL